MLCVSSTFLCLHRTCGCLQWLESKPQTALLHASQLSLVDTKQMSKWRCKCATALFFPLRDFSLCQNRQIKDVCSQSLGAAFFLHLNSFILSGLWVSPTAAQHRDARGADTETAEPSKTWQSCSFADLVEPQGPHRDIPQAKATAVTKFSFPFPTRVVQELFFKTWIDFFF